MRPEVSASVLVKAVHGSPVGSQGHKVYTAPSGVLCVGWGHPISLSSHDLPLAPDTAERLLEHHLSVARNQLRGLIQFPLDTHHLEALTAWAWSITMGHASGPGQQWKSSTLLRYVAREKFIQASGEFDRWCISNGRVNRSQMAAREMERSLFCTGEMPLLG